MNPLAGRGVKRRDVLRFGLGATIAWGLGSFADLARGVEDAERSPERIFFYGELIVGAERLRGTFAVDPEAGTWVRIMPEGTGWTSVSPDGRTMAYARYKLGGEKEPGTWTRGTRGDDEPRRISEIVGHPFWSRDGQRLIVRGAGPDGTSDRFETWQVRLDGSEPARLPIPETECVLDWSADDAWLLVSSNREGGQDFVNRPVSVVRPDGTDARLVTEGSDLVRWRHRFADGGKRVTYFQVEKNDDCRLWIVDFDGRNRRVFLGEAEDRAPFGSVSSPDGRRAAILYFDRTPREDGKRSDIIRGCTIEIVDADGTNPRPVSLPETGTLQLLDWR